MRISKNVFYTMTYTVTQHKLSHKMTPKPLSQKMTCFQKVKMIFSIHVKRSFSKSQDDILNTCEEVIFKRSR